MLKLQSDPPAMRVVFDGVAFGRTPMTIEVPEGAHQLELSDGTNSGTFAVSGGKGPGRMCFVVESNRVTTGKCP